MNKKLPFAILMAMLLFSSAKGEEKLSRFEYEEPHMGTKFRIVLYAKEKSVADQAAKAGFTRVAQLNAIMSDYLATSELNQLGKKFEVKVGDPVNVSDDLFFVLAKAQEVSKLSDGAFDVTVRPLVILWRQARRTQRLPAKEELDAAMNLVGYRKMELDAEKKTVQFTVPGMQLDLGGIAKGHAADEVLKEVAKHGIHSALCAAGGDIAVSDAPLGSEGWKIDIASLPGSKDNRAVRLANAAISTSGDAEQFAVIDGVRYSHIVNPKTGIGLTGRRSVTVIARRGIDSDSMTKMASILPPEKATALFEELDGMATLIVLKTEKGEEAFASLRFGGYLIPSPKP